MTNAVARAGVGPKALLLVVVLCVLAAAPLAGGVDAAKDDLYKAVFIYYFIDYIEWPAEASTGPVVVGFVGESGVVGRFEEVARTKRVEDRALEVRRVSAPADLVGCHVAFLSAASMDKLAEVLKHVEGAPVLTIVEGETSVPEGVAIGFTRVEGALKFAIRRPVLARAGLKASSQLLKLAVLLDD